MAATPSYVAKFTAPDLSARQIAQPGSVVFDVERYSWHCIGGPKAARIKALGNPNDLWEFMSWLRAPVEIYQEGWPPVWWGYVHSAEVVINRARLKLTLDGMSNRVALAHTITSGTSATRSTTAWAEDALSIDRYGYKELLTSSQATTTAAAEAARDDQLNQVGRPIASVQFNGTMGEAYAAIECRGWWDTLGWRYYTNAGVASVANETQIAAIVAASGQFTPSVEVVGASGLSTPETRNGDKTALTILAELMASGISGGRRYLSTVHPTRLLQLSEQPAADSGTIWTIDTTGRIRNPAGHEIQPATCPVGYWASIGNYLPAQGRNEVGLGFSRFFVEEAEYVVSGSEYRPVATGMVNPWALARRLVK